VDNFFLLLLVVLSAHSESPQQGEPPDSFDSTLAAACPNSSSDPLGVLASGLPHGCLDLSYLRMRSLDQCSINFSCLRMRCSIM